MSQRRLIKTVSLLLVFGLLLSYVPGGAIAQTAEANLDTSAAATTDEISAAAFQLDADCQILTYIDEEAFWSQDHVARLTEQEDLDTYVFLNADGSQTVYYMDENVKFLDGNGVVREKDIKLTASTSGYSTTRNNVGLNLPTNLAQGITLSYNGYDVNLIPENILSATTVRQQNGKVAYLNCYGKGTGLIYTPTLSGMKEDILLSSYTGVNSFSFLLNTDGLNMYQNEQGRWYLAQSANATTKMEMADIVAYDANTRHSLGSISVTTITAGQQYRLTVTIDEAFLTAETTAYPVLIDPSITVSDNTHGSDSIEDATVYSTASTLNTGTWTTTYAGYYDATHGVGRTVVRLKSLLSDSAYQSVSATQIQSAIYYLKESTNTAPVQVNLFPLNDDATWTETSVTWNDVESFDGVLQDSHEMGYNNTYGFNITNLVKAWKNGSYSNGQCGFMVALHAELEAEKGFYSSEYSTTTRRPYVVVTYSEADEFVTINENATKTLSKTGISGTITWKSDNTSIARVSSSGVVTGVHAGKAYITASVGGVVKKSFSVQVLLPTGDYQIKLQGYSHYLTPNKVSYASRTGLKTQPASTDQTGALSQIWYISHVGNGYYTISAKHKNTLRITANDGIYPALSTSTSNNTHKWKIEYKGSGYVITNVYYSNYVLTGAGTADSFVTLSSYSSSDTKQRWLLTGTNAAGIMLLDSETGERRDSAAFDDHIPANVNAYNSLESMGLDLHIFGASNVNYNITFSNPTLATYYQASELIYGENAGQTTATISATIANVQYTLSFPLLICNDQVAVQILYDNAYASRYSNYASRIAYQTQKIKDVFADQLFIYVDVLPAQRFLSYADTCEYGYASNCDDSCGTCLNSTVDASGNIDYSNSHHKNAYNILVRVPQYPDAKTLAYIGHNTCSEKDALGFHKTGGLYGLAYNILGVAEVLDHTDVSSTEPIHSAMTSVHEFGHLLGTPDHYNTGETEALNSSVDGDPFNDDCIYGKNFDEEAIYEALTICEGCRGVINGDIVLP